MWLLLIGCIILLVYLLDLLLIGFMDSNYCGYISFISSTSDGLNFVGFQFLWFLWGGPIHEFQYPLNDNPHAKNSTFTVYTSTT